MGVLTVEETRLEAEIAGHMVRIQGMIEERAMSQAAEECVKLAQKLHRMHHVLARLEHLRAARSSDRWYKG